MDSQIITGLMKNDLGEEDIEKVKELIVGKPITDKPIWMKDSKKIGTITDVKFRKDGMIEYTAEITDPTHIKLLRAGIGPQGISTK